MSSTLIFSEDGDMMLSDASHFAAIFGIPLIATVTYALLTVSIMTITYCKYAWRWRIDPEDVREEQDGRELKLSSPSPLLQVHDDLSAITERQLTALSSIENMQVQQNVSYLRHEASHEAVYDINEESGAVYIVPTRGGSHTVTISEDVAVIQRANDATTSATNSSAQDNALYLTML